MEYPSGGHRHIVIIGGGVIGCTTAYYLTRHPAFPKSTADPSNRVTVTILEASVHGAAQGASGKAGGLVARWAYPAGLARLSFDEHLRLAQEHGGAQRWGWRFVEGGNWRGRGRRRECEREPENLPIHTSGTGGRAQTSSSWGRGRGKEKKTTRRSDEFPEDLNWIDGGLTEAYAPLAARGETGQVHPYLFTKSMLALAEERGVDFVRSRAVALVKEHSSENGKARIIGVDYVPEVNGGEREVRHLQATHVVLAAGPWSPCLLPVLPVSGICAHSITVRPRAEDGPIAAYAIFAEIKPPSYSDGAKRTFLKTVRPEMYARPDGEVYVCGSAAEDSDEEEEEERGTRLLPETVDEVEVDERECERLYEDAASVSKVLRDGKVEKRQACFLPVVRGGRAGPILGEVREVAERLIVACGHSCWGICNAPGTARAISELIFDAEIKCADLSELRPSSYT